MGTPADGVKCEAATFAKTARHEQNAIDRESTMKTTLDELLALRTVVDSGSPLQDSTLRARPLGSSSLRVVASPAYLKERGRVKSVAQLLGHHTLLGFGQPESLNHWPLRGPHGDRLHIAPAVKASSGETLRQLVLNGAGLACLADFMTAEDRRRGDLVQVLPRDTVEVLQPIHAVYYRNTQLSSRIACFLDFLGERMAAMPWAALPRKPAAKA